MQHRKSAATASYGQVNKEPLDNVKMHLQAKREHFVSGLNPLSA
jgi:hypothetical protein